MTVRGVAFAAGMAGVAAAGVAGCGHSGSSAAAVAGNSTLVAKRALPTASPNVFVMGLSSTEKVAGGQRVKLTVGGPALRSPIKGQPVQFAPDLLETFTITASLAAGRPVTLGSGDFVLRRAVGGDTPVNGPARVTIAPGAPRTFTVSAIQTPGQGSLEWRSGAAVIGRWAFVAEND